MSGYRKAALMLASLAESDRAWLLGQLGEKERERLGALLEELRGLGLSADAGMLDLALPREPAPQPASPAPRPVDAATPQAMHDVLAHEPDWLIAALSRTRAWSWREGFLRLLGTERRLRTQQALPSGVELRPKTVEALLAAVERRLEERLDLEDETPAEVPPFAAHARKPFWRGGMSWRR